MGERVAKARGRIPLQPEAIGGLWTKPPAYGNWGQSSKLAVGAKRVWVGAPSSGRFLQFFNKNNSTFLSTFRIIKQ